MYSENCGSRLGKWAELAVAGNSQTAPMIFSPIFRICMFFLDNFITKPQLPTFLTHIVFGIGGVRIKGTYGGDCRLQM